MQLSSCHSQEMVLMFNALLGRPLVADCNKTIARLTKNKKISLNYQFPQRLIALSVGIYFFTLISIFTQWKEAPSIFIHSHSVQGDLPAGGRALAAFTFYTQNIVSTLSSPGQESW